MDNTKSKRPDKEAERNAERLNDQLRDEQQKRRKVETELSSLKEQMGDVKSSKESLAKTQTEKQKWTEEKELLRQELEDTKKFYETELSKLKTKDHKSSTDQVPASHSGPDINKEWQAKCDQLVSASEARHQVALSALKSQCSTLEKKVKEMEAKNANVQSQANIMQEKYQERIDHLEKSQDEGNNQNLITEVKRIMSSVYHNLKKEFADELSYGGADINNTIMDTIKAVTMQMIQTQTEEMPVISEVIVKETGHSTGGGGNPYYAAELEKKEISEVIVMEARPTTGGGGNPYYAAELEKKEIPVVSEVIVKTAGHTTGGGGNPHYAAELEKPEICEVIMKEARPTTGGGGNPYYAAELEKKDKSKLDGIVVSDAAPSATEKTKPKPEEINQKVDLLKNLVSQKNSTDQEKDSVKEDVVKPVVASSQGNPPTAKPGKT